jgi:hypothetical protein
MFSMIKTALATSIVLGSASLALAQGGAYDPNPANRYPAYAEPGTYGYSPNANAPVRLHPAPHAKFQSAPAQLHQGRNAARTGGQENWSTIDRNDHASSPNAGGGGW